MVSSKSVVYEALTKNADTELYRLIGANVWWDQVPELPDSIFEAEHACIVIQLGNENVSIVNEVSITFRCYGGTDKMTDAEAVYRALHDLLQENHDAMESGVIVYAEQETASSMIEPETGFPVFLVTYRITISNYK